MRYRSRTGKRKINHQLLFWGCFAHRALAAFRAALVRCSGVRLPLRVAAPFMPPLRPISRMISETVALSFRPMGIESGEAEPVAWATMDAASWFMSWERLRVRLGTALLVWVTTDSPLKTKKNPKDSNYPATDTF
jgi:hypothetical protein